MLVIAFLIIIMVRRMAQKRARSSVLWNQIITIRQDIITHNNISLTNKILILDLI